MINKILLTISLQVFLICFSIRIVASPVWIQIAYNFPIFETDILNVPKTQRLEFALETLTGLNSTDENAQLIFQNIEYNDREITHLIDVKRLFEIYKFIWIISTLAFLVLSRSLIEEKKFSQNLKQVSKYSGLFFVTLATIIVIFWDTTFNLFHQSLFEPGSWLFYETDLLIRLFPPIFWLMSAILLFTLLLIFQIFIYLLSKIYIAKNL